MKKFYYWCVALSVPIITLVTLLSCFSVDVPLIDDYDAVLRYLVQPFPERLLHLADFNSEHRIFTARIVFECIYQALGHFDFRACMTIGAIFLLGYGILFYYLLPFDASDGACSRLERWYFVPAIWLVVSVLNNDNICWAMTSVSNVPVHFWALLSILLFAKRRSAFCIVIGIACAVLATFSTGCGMAVWGALAFLLIHEWLLVKGGWSTAFRERRTLLYGSRKVFLVVLLSGITSVVLYLQGLGTVASKESTTIWNMLLFFLSFLGGVIPYFGLSIMVGLIVLCVLILMLVELPRIKNTAAMAFVFYLVMCVCAATPFRSFRVMSAIEGRYRIISVSIVVVLLLLIIPCIRNFSRKIQVAIVCLFSIVTLAYLVAFSLVSLPNLANRNEMLVRGILAWPDDSSGLIFDDKKLDASLLLKESREKGIYDPRLAVGCRNK